MFPLAYTTIHNFGWDSFKSQTQAFFILYISILCHMLHLYLYKYRYRNNRLSVLSFLFQIKIHKEDNDGTQVDSEYTVLMAYISTIYTQYFMIDFQVHDSVKIRDAKNHSQGSKSPML